MFQQQHASFFFFFKFQIETNISNKCVEEEEERKRFKAQITLGF